MARSESPAFVFSSVSSSAVSLISIARQRLAISSASLAMRSASSAAFPVPDLAVPQVPAKPVVFEHPHPTALYAERYCAQFRGRGSERILESVLVLPEERRCIRIGTLPLEGVERGDDRDHFGALCDNEQRRALHQVKIQAREVKEIRTRHECGRIEACIADQAGRPFAASSRGRS